jgi:hypothetical protein
MVEVWRDVVGYTGRYEVSNLGNVRNYSTKKLLTPRIDDGYRKVVLSRSALDRKYVKIARLVAEAFIPNPLNLPQVIHKDRVRIHDYEYNLEWCANRYNSEHALGKAVIVLNEDGVPLSVHPSATKAAEHYGYSPQLVSQKCKTGRPTRDGLTFVYFDSLRRCPD